MAAIDTVAALAPWLLTSSQVGAMLDRFYGGLDLAPIRGEVDLAEPLGPGHNAAEYARLKIKLGLEESSMLNRDGQLTETAIKTAEQIPLKDPIKNPKVIAELTKDGSSITDWGKFRTVSTLARNGQRVQIHFYKNLKTEAVNLNVDFKVSNVTYLGDVNLNQ